LAIRYPRLQEVSTALTQQRKIQIDDQRLVGHMTICNKCGVELPRDEWFHIHRMHTDALYRTAQALGWEASFMVDGNEPLDSNTVMVLDAECEPVCIANSHVAAEVIVKALEEFWDKHKLDGGE
jgi:hypothetical protein